MAEVYGLSKLVSGSYEDRKGFFSCGAVKLHMGELIKYRFIRLSFVVREIVAAIKEFRARSDLTQEELANKVGVRRVNTTLLLN